MQTTLPLTLFTMDEMDFIVFKPFVNIKNFSVKIFYILYSSIYIS
ncbi:hypothetical protein ABOONEI_2554 [Aciduliprofundum boonei T469]|nr:hypothetical protein ABOONEI_2554 [Aciduliprofundum boonei T469]